MVVVKQTMKVQGPVPVCPTGGNRSSHIPLCALAFWRGHRIHGFLPTYVNNKIISMFPVQGVGGFLHKVALFISHPLRTRGCILNRVTTGDGVVMGSHSPSLYAKIDVNPGACGEQEFSISTEQPGACVCTTPKVWLSICCPQSGFIRQPTCGHPVHYSISDAHFIDDCFVCFQANGLPFDQPQCSRCIVALCLSNCRTRFCAGIFRNISTLSLSHPLYLCF
jgi:hypothetical protein